MGALLRARGDGLLQVVEEGDPDGLPQFDPGESSTLTAAAHAGGAVLVDERKARALVASHPGLNGKIPYGFGVIGLILLAKRRGHIPAVRPLLDDLIGQSFWISPEFYRRVLQQAGES